MTDHTTSQDEYEAAVEAAKRRHPSFVGSPQREAPVAAEPRFATNLARHGSREVVTAA